MADGEESDQSGGKIYLFQVVEFLTRGRKKNQKRITDIVPSSWISFDIAKKKYTCPFGPPPFTGIQNLVKKQGSPDTSWQTFNVKIKGQAETYKEAEKKLKKLEKEENAFTTDADGDSKQKVEQLEKAFRIRQLKESVNRLHTTMGSQERSKNTSNQISDSSSDNEHNTPSDTTHDTPPGSPIGLSSNIKVRPKLVSNTKFDTKNSPAAAAKIILPKKRTSEMAGSPRCTAVPKKYIIQSENLESNTCVKNTKLTPKSVPTTYKTNKNISADVKPSTSSCQDRQDPKVIESLNCIQLREKNFDFPVGTTITYDDTIILPVDHSDYIPSKQISQNVDIVQNTIENVYEKGTDISRNEYSDIMKKLISVEEKVKAMNKSIHNIEGLLQQTLNCKEVDKTTLEHFGMEFPIKTINDLYNLEGKLADPELRKNMIPVVSRLIDPEETLSKNVTAVIKKFLSRDVAMLFTATRKMDKKIVFKLNVPNVCNCIVDTIIRRQNTTEAKVYAALGTTFTHSKDWEGYRTARTKSKEDGIDDMGG